MPPVLQWRILYMVSLIRQQKPLIFMSNSVKNQLILISFFGIQKFGMYTKLPTIQWKSKKAIFDKKSFFAFVAAAAMVTLSEVWRV